MATVIAQDEDLEVAVPNDMRGTKEDGIGLAMNGEGHAVVTDITIGLDDSQIYYQKPSWNCIEFVYPKGRHQMCSAFGKHSPTLFTKLHVSDEMHVQVNNESKCVTSVSTATSGARTSSNNLFVPTSTISAQR